MIADLNVDDFYKDAARTLVTLYRVFPRPVAIYVEDISGADEPDEYGLHSLRHQACFAALLWLGEEGYLRYDDTIRQDAIDQAVLTGRCFSALLTPTGAPVADGLPQSVQLQRQSLIFQLTEALSEKSSLSIRATLTPLMEQMSWRSKG